MCVWTTVKHLMSVYKAELCILVKVTYMAGSGCVRVLVILIQGNNKLLYIH